MKPFQFIVESGVKHHNPNPLTPFVQTKPFLAYQTTGPSGHSNYFSCSVRKLCFTFRSFSHDPLAQMELKYFLNSCLSKVISETGNFN